MGEGGNDSKKSDYVALFKEMKGEEEVSPKVTKIDLRGKPLQITGDWLI